MNNELQKFKNWAAKNKIQNVQYNVIENVIASGHDYGYTEVRFNVGETKIKLTFTTANGELYQADQVNEFGTYDLCDYQPGYIASIRALNKLIKGA